MKKLKAIGRIALIVFVSVVLGVNIYTWNAQSLMGNVLPMPFGFGGAVVLTGSMEPTIMANDVILVAQRDSYSVDDIVVYQSGSILVVHRVVGIDGNMVTTKGDANQVADEPVDKGLIKGKVIGVIPKAGSLVRILKTPTATLILVAGAVMLMEASYRREKKKGSDDLEKIKEEIRRLKEEQ